MSALRLKFTTSPKVDEIKCKVICVGGALNVATIMYLACLTFLNILYVACLLGLYGKYKTFTPWYQPSVSLQADISGFRSYIRHIHLEAMVYILHIYIYIYIYNEQTKHTQTHTIPPVYWYSAILYKTLRASVIQHLRSRWYSASEGWDARG